MDELRERHLGPQARRRPAPDGHTIPTANRLRSRSVPLIRETPDIVLGRRRLQGSSQEAVVPIRSASSLGARPGRTSRPADPRQALRHPSDERAGGCNSIARPDSFLPVAEWLWLIRRAGFGRGSLYFCRHRLGRPPRHREEYLFRLRRAVGR